VVDARRKGEALCPPHNGTGLKFFNVPCSGPTRDHTRGENQSLVDNRFARLQRTDKAIHFVQVATVKGHRRRQRRSAEFIHVRKKKVVAREAVASSKNRTRRCQDIQISRMARARTFSTI